MLLASADRKLGLLTIVVRMNIRSLVLQKTSGHRQNGAVKRGKRLRVSSD
jgi:hypothetical protein